MEITKGKVGLSEIDSGGFIIMSPPEIGRHIAFVNVTTQGEKVARNNAKLIAEAFNVTNETGKSPRQLADENKELLEACQKALNYFTKNINEIHLKNDPKIIALREAINRTTK